MIQYLEKYSSTVQQLAYSGWLWVNRQEKLLTGGQRGSERWWSWRIQYLSPAAIGDGGQAAISLKPDTDGTYIRIFENSQLEGW